MKLRPSGIFFCIILALAGLALHSARAQADDVRICNAYGTGFAYSPGTDTCVNLQTGETRRQTMLGTRLGETDTIKTANQGLAEASRAADRAYKSATGAMVAAAMPVALINGSDHYGFAANLSTFGGFSAVGTGLTIRIPTTNVHMTLGVGLGLNQTVVGSRIGLNFSL